MNKLVCNTGSFNFGVSIRARIISFWSIPILKFNLKFSATTSKKRLIPLAKSPAKLIQASNSPPRSAKKTREKSAEKRNLIRANSTAESNKVDEEIPKTPPRIRKEPMKKRKLASNQDLMLLESASESERGGPRARSRVLLNDPENRVNSSFS